MARAFQSQVTLLTVLERGTRLDCTYGVDPLEWRIRKLEAESYLRGLTDRLQESGLPLKKRTLEGEAAEQIVDFAHYTGVNLIILSSHGQSGLTTWANKISAPSARARVVARGQTHSARSEPSMGTSNRR